MSLDRLVLALSNFVMTMSMAGVGLGVHLRGLARVGVKAVYVGLFATVVLAVFSFGLLKIALSRYSTARAAQSAVKIAGTATPLRAAWSRVERRASPCSRCDVASSLSNFARSGARSEAPETPTNIAQTDPNDSAAETHTSWTNLSAGPQPATAAATTATNGTREATPTVPARALFAWNSAFTRIGRCVEIMRVA